MTEGISLAIHRLAYVKVGVPDVDAAAEFYRDFGLAQSSGSQASFSTREGGVQLYLSEAPSRRLLEIAFGVDDVDDLEIVRRRLEGQGLSPLIRGSEFLTVTEPVSGFRASALVSSRTCAEAADPVMYNRPGRADRPNSRSIILDRNDAVRPRRLGHVVIGSKDQQTTQSFFIDGFGLRVRDDIPGLASFLSCSEDHHNVLVQQAPVNFLHHTAWEVDDVDDVGRGATRMIDKDPSRHVWGLGRHYIGSNYFWYLKDPAGSFCEYYADLDVITDDTQWSARRFHGTEALYTWGPPPPPSFNIPDDIRNLAPESFTGHKSDR